MIYDLQTGETYDFVLHASASKIVFWTRTGPGQARESEMALDALTEPFDLKTGPVTWCTVARFQILDTDETQPPEFIARRKAFGRPGTKAAATFGGPELAQVPATFWDRLGRMFGHLDT